MGQAKLRGTYEDRKAAAIARDKAIAEAKRKAYLEAEAAKTPEQRQAEHEQSLKIAKWMQMFRTAIYNGMKQ